MFIYHAFSQSLYALLSNNERSFKSNQGKVCHLWSVVQSEMRCRGGEILVGEVWRATPRVYTARLSRSGQTMDHILITCITLVCQTWGKGVGGCQEGRGWLVHNRKQIANIVFGQGSGIFPAAMKHKRERIQVRDCWFMLQREIEGLGKYSRVTGDIRGLVLQTG